MDKSLLKVKIGSSPFFMELFVVASNFDEASKKAVKKAHDEGFDQLNEAHVESIEVICNDHRLAI